MDREHAGIISYLEEAAHAVGREKKQQERLNRQKAIRKAKVISHLH